MLKQSIQLKNPLMVAPMMGWTTRHYRYFLRLITKNIQLYTEMITASAILRGEYRHHLLAYHADEHPLAIQLGGGVPTELAQAAKIVEDYGYTEINLNVGCPSNRAQAGCFGALLMKKVDFVAECIAKMDTAVQLPITVKTRIGVDDYESYDYLAHFIQKVSTAGCQTFIVHARKACLAGLSPKENREIPSLNYAWVYQLKQDFPALNIVINGGIKSLQESYLHLRQVDGVMIGRAAWYNPYLFRAVDCLHEKCLLQDTICARKTIAQHYIPYAQAAFNRGENLSHVLQALFGLFFGVQGASRWRSGLTQIIQNGLAPEAPLKKLLDELVDYPAESFT